MPDISENKTTATTYPPDTLYRQWCKEAEEQDMTISQYIMAMVEAGRKQIDIETVADESAQELRQQRADLRQELEHERTRVAKLEQHLHQTAQSDILEYIENNPGASTPAIIQRVADTVPTRVASHLDILEGEEIERQDDGYYLITDNKVTDPPAPSSTRPSIRSGDPE